MSAPGDFTEQQLRAYLAGDAPGDVAAEIEAALERDEALAERLAALDDTGDLLQPAFKTLLQAAPAERLADRFLEAVAELDPGAADGNQAQSSRPSRGWVGRAAGWGLSTAVLTAAGFALGLWLGQPSLQPPSTPEERVAQTLPLPTPPGWVTAVADYVRLFSDETFAEGPPDAGDLARDLARVGGRLALELRPEALALDGLTLQRVELLQLKGNPLAQLAYLDADGRLVALCILHREGKSPEAMTSPLVADAVDRLNAVHWDRQPHGFLLIGELPFSDLEALARDLRGRFG